MSYELHLDTTITFKIIYYDPFIQYIFSQQYLTTLVMIAKLTPQNINNLVWGHRLRFYFRLKSEIKVM